MLTIPFLTDVDSREEVKGSRDPLGAQAVWTRFGRHVVKNLTTVSTLLRDFTVTILGYHFAERVAEDVEPGNDLATFLKWEQLAGYARAKVHGDRSFRGRTLVHERLNERRRIVLAEDRSGQILSNQKIYGLWGLYTSPARESGLLTHGDPPRNAPPARELVEDVYLPLLAKHGFKNGRAITKILSEHRPSIDPHAKDLPLLQAVAKLLDPKVTPRERAVYRRCLVDGGAEEATFDNVQPLMARLFLDRRHERDFAFSPATIAALANDARKQGEVGEQLAHLLDRIRICESLLAPMSMLYGYLLTTTGTSPADVASRLRKEWGPRLATIVVNDVKTLGLELRAVSEEGGARWIAIAEAAASGEYDELLRLLVEQNRHVMASRDAGGAWIEIRDGRFDVRFRDDEGRLPKKDELASLWRFPYFLDSLRTIALTVEGPGNAS